MFVELNDSVINALLAILCLLEISSETSNSQNKRFLFVEKGIPRTTQFVNLKSV